MLIKAFWTRIVKQKYFGGIFGAFSQNKNFFRRRESKGGLTRVKFFAFVSRNLVYSIPIDFVP